MENHISGSLKLSSGSFDYDDEYDLDTELQHLMASEQFEDDLINSFTVNMYTVVNEAPRPLWVYCSITHRLVRIWPSTEVVVLNEQGFRMSKKDDNIDCLVGQNLIKIPKKYINSGEWN